MEPTLLPHVFLRHPSHPSRRQHSSALLLRWKERRRWGRNQQSLGRRQKERQALGWRPSLPKRRLHYWLVQQAARTLCMLLGWNRRMHSTGLDQPRPCVPMGPMGSQNNKKSPF